MPSILIVDDRPEKLLALEAVLEDLGTPIVRAYSGREALRALLQQEFAVVLLDVNMPGMDGFETASLIRQRKSSQHTPIIFITAFGDDLHMARGYSLGAVDYIQTPVVPEVLRTKVSVFVDVFRKTKQIKQQAESLRRRAEQLQKLTAASVAINSAPSIPAMLQTVTETARDIIGAHQSITLFFNTGVGRSGGPSEAVASFSDRYASWRNQPLQLDEVAHTLVAQSHLATRLTETELRQHPDWKIVQRLKIPPIQGGMMAAPLRGRDGVRLGVIYLADRCEGQFTTDDEAILVQLSQMASTAIENMLFSQEREANRLKDEFLATLSHELRTPLNAILGWAQILRMEELTGDAAHGLEVIERNVRAQTRLIEDLLDVSRITTGKLRLNVRRISLASVVSAAADAVGPAAAAKNISLDIPALDDSLQLSADADRLQQVIWNLLNNAVKFTPNGGHVRLQAEPAGNQISIRIADTGRGISREFLPYVFDRFRQADSTSTRSHGGLGIGLTIVRHIVELHGGAVHAQSEGEGKGSLFTILLPAGGLPEQPADPRPRSPAVNLQPVSLSPMEDLEGLRILLVDDESDARELLGEVLRRRRATVRTAGSAAEAMDQLASFRPDLLISDIAMPDRDGYELIRQIRQLPPDQGGQIPALALTAYARPEDQLRALESGFQTHLAKPVEPALLISTLASLAPTPDESLGIGLKFG